MALKNTESIRQRKFDLVRASSLQESTSFLPHISLTPRRQQTSSTQPLKNKSRSPPKLDHQTESIISSNGFSMTKHVALKGSDSPYFHLKDTFSPKTDQFDHRSPNFSRKKFSFNSLSNHNMNSTGDSIMQSVVLSPINNPDVRSIAQRNNSLTKLSTDSFQKGPVSGSKEIFQLTADFDAVAAGNQSYLKYCNLKELDKQTRLEQVRDSLNLNKPKSFKSLFKDTTPQIAARESQNISMLNANDMSKRLSKGYRIGANQRKKAFQLSSISNDYLHPTSLSKEYLFSESENKSSTYNNSTLIKESFDQRVRQDSVQMSNEENRRHNSISDETTFEKYYKRKEPANRVTKHKMLLSTLQKINKYKTELEQEGMRSRLEALAEVQRKNQERMERASLQKVREAKSLLKFATDAINEQNDRTAQLIQQFVDEFGC